MGQVIAGYRFKMCWPSTAMMVRVNATSREEADRKLWKWTRKGAIPHFQCVCEPWPRERRAKMPHKVF